MPSIRDRAPIRGAFLIFAGSFLGMARTGPLRRRTRSAVVHSIQPVTFFTGALVFWCASLSRRGRRNPLAGMALGFAATIQGAWGGTVFVFSNQAIYDPYLSTT